MADATTSNYSLTKPEVGASNDTWGDKLNDNFDDIDSLLGGGTAVAGINITSGTISGITDLAVADGGTGASTASGARTNLGLAIGTDVQAYDAQLADVAGLTPSDSYFIVGNGSNFVTESGSTARSSLGLGSIATQNSNSVSITGGSMSGVALSSCSGSISQFTNNSGYVTSSGVTSVATGTGLTGGTITSTGTLSLATAGAGAAPYSSGISAITVDAYGRVTSVSGSAGYTTNTGDITGVTAGNGLTGGGSSGSVSLAMSGSFTGSFTASGDVTAYSDERLKNNVETLDGSKVLQMRGVSFTKDGKAGSGVIAQELEKIAPELVYTADDEMGTKSVAYGNLVGYLIEAVKELSEKVKKLEES
jgi:hypothetical protein